MSRSYKHISTITMCNGSNKEDKRFANRKFRRISKEKIHQHKIPLQNINECSNTYDFKTDGLSFYDSNIDKKYLRK